MMAMEVVKLERIEAPKHFHHSVRWARVTTASGATHDQLLTDYVHSLLGNDERGFFRAAWSLSVGWRISERVSAQDW